MNDHVRALGLLLGQLALTVLSIAILIGFCVLFTYFPWAFVGLIVFGILVYAYNGCLIEVRNKRVRDSSPS